MSTISLPENSLLVVPLHHRKPLRFQHTDYVDPKSITNRITHFGFCTLNNINGVQYNHAAFSWPHSVGRSVSFTCGSKNVTETHQERRGAPSNYGTGIRVLFLVSPISWGRGYPWLYNGPSEFGVGTCIVDARGAH